MRKAKKWFLLAFVCLFTSLSLFGYNLYEDYKVKKFQNDIINKYHPIEKDDTYLINPYKQMNSIDIDGIKYSCLLKIPNLGLELLVASEYNEPNLKNGPCVYQGSIYLKNLILVGHNYTSQFGKLTSIAYGEEIILEDVSGNIFNYEVVDVMKISQYDVDSLLSLDYDLIMFTCTLSRSERIVVGCKML